MSKNSSNSAAAALPLPEPDHEHDHDKGHAHGESPEKQAAFLSLVYRVFRENNDLRSAYATLLNQTVKALLRCLEERDAYTYGHSMRVMSYALMIGRGTQLKESDMKNLELSAMFHDIGKLGIPDCVLLKPGRLNAQEQKIIQSHPVKSGEILEIIDAFKNLVPGARHHHERMDGEGYPDRLSGNSIPLASRIILVADTFDAMTSTRPYRKALPFEVAYAELERFSGSQFDPDFVKVFLQEHKRLVMTGDVQEEKEKPPTLKAA